MDEKRILCVVAGKSGGHIIPGMTYVRNFTRVYSDYSVLFFSTDSQLDRSIIALYPYVFSYVPLKLMGIPGKKIWLYPLFFLQFLRSYFVSLRQFTRMRPEKVVSMGGYISLPVCLAARSLRIPIELFELNAVPGKAVLWLAPLARKIYVCFDEARAYFKKEKVALTEYPLRFSSQDRMLAASARIQLGLDPAKKTIVILGGSQGSRSINDLMKGFFNAHKKEAATMQVIHQAGSHGVAALKEFYHSLGIPAFVFDYDHNLQLSYCAADLIIARAGAGTLFEIGFFEKRALIIPLEVASTAHQVENAYAMRSLDEMRARYSNRTPLFTVVRQKEIEADPTYFYTLIQQEG